MNLTPPTTDWGERVKEAGLIHQLTGWDFKDTVLIRVSSLCGLALTQLCAHGLYSEAEARETYRKGLGMDDKIDSIIEEREKTHGSYPRVANISQSCKQSLRGGESYHKLNDPQVEAVDLICTKLARLVSGDPMTPDHWDDIAGYALLGRKSIL